VERDRRVGRERGEAEELDRAADVGPLQGRVGVEEVDQAPAVEDGVDRRGERGEARLVEAAPRLREVAAERRERRPVEGAEARLVARVDERQERVVEPRGRLAGVLGADEREDLGVALRREEGREEVGPDEARRARDEGRARRVDLRGERRVGRRVEQRRRADRRLCPGNPFNFAST
jgi:hypothetical protein